MALETSSAPGRMIAEGGSLRLSTPPETPQKQKLRRGKRNMNPTVTSVLAFDPTASAGQGEPCVLVSLSGAPATQDLGGARMMLRKEHWERLVDAGAPCWVLQHNGQGGHFIRSNALAAIRLEGARGKCWVHLSRVIAAWASINVPDGYAVRYLNGDSLDLRPVNMEVVKNGLQKGFREWAPRSRLVMQH